MSTLDVKFFYYFYIRFLSLGIIVILSRITLCVRRCPSHCRIFSSLPGPRPLEASSTHPFFPSCNNKKCLQTLPYVLWEDKIDLD